MTPPNFSLLPGLKSWDHYRPFNWDLDSRISKKVYFGEGGTRYVQVAVDVFNVFNNQGLNAPGTNGVTDLNTSFGGYGFQPRQVQGSFRFQF